MAPGAVRLMYCQIAPRGLPSLRGIRLTAFTATIYAGSKWWHYPSHRKRRVYRQWREAFIARGNIRSRVSKPELGVDLFCPDYKAGWAALLKVEKLTS